MFGKKVKSRMVVLLLFVIISTVAITFIFRSLDENLVYFFSPSEIKNKTNISLNKKIRIGGLVKDNSYIKSFHINTFIDCTAFFTSNIYFLIVSYLWLKTIL